ncbi:MAG: PD-(D/E)XK nuclease family protein [Candidatus Pacearchaeota archaeon]|jgi:putative RecB family exonuclease
MPIYSHSRLSAFEQCPLKYKFRYIDNLQPDIKQTIEGFLGNKVHDTLELLYINAMKGNVMELDSVIQFFAEKWKKELTPEIKIVKEDLDYEYYFNKGIKFLIDYYSKHYPFKDNTIALEKRIIVKIDSQGKYVLQGFIDRLVHNKENNTYEIHDYKTSGTLKKQEEIDNDRQLALYSIGIFDSFENVNDVHLFWHFLDFNQTLKSRRTKEQLENLKNEIVEVIKKIENAKEFPANPSILCKWCEFRSYCTYKDNYLQNKNDNSLNNNEGI